MKKSCKIVLIPKWENKGSPDTRYLYYDLTLPDRTNVRTIVRSENHIISQSSRHIYIITSVPVSYAVDLSGYGRCVANEEQERIVNRRYTEGQGHTR